MGETIEYAYYKGPSDMPEIMALVDAELSEPYTIYTYHYFLDTWPHLCFVARAGSRIVGTIICKQDHHGGKLMRGYIGMLSIEKEYRKRGIGVSLVRIAVQEMVKARAQEIVLETECDNHAALALYTKLGFIKEKALYGFYTNRKSAFRLVLAVGEQVL